MPTRPKSVMEEAPTDLKIWGNAANIPRMVPIMYRRRPSMTRTTGGERS